jgi:hypothetical protein
LGSCAWITLAPEERQQVLDAYAVNGETGAARLARSQSALKQAFAACAQRQDVPLSWAGKAIGAAVAQDAAAARLSATRGLLRAELNTAWEAAPEAVRECLRAQAAGAFGAKAQPCDSGAASRWFFTRLRLDPRADRRAALDLAAYLAARAQGEWAEALIREFLARSAN